jgi:uncharacterized membrane protein YcgQ (UPF0703/DUF1980 family)
VVEGGDARHVHVVHAHTEHNTIRGLLPSNCLHFPQTALDATNASVRHDMFESTVIEIRKEDWRRFVEFLYDHLQQAGA